MKVLAVIPARGGSKGIPLKNLRQVGGRSLVGWAVAAAKESKIIDTIAVSSDSAEILLEGQRAGAVPILRPIELATDTASTDDALVSAVRSMRQGYTPDLVVLLQPTVPVRREGLVDDCIRRLIEVGADSLLTAYRLHFVWRQIDWMSEPKWSSPYSNVKHRPRRQDMEKHLTYFAEDGSVFVSTASLLLETGARLGGKIEVFETERTVDIDTEADLALADALLRSREAVPA